MLRNKHEKYAIYGQRKLEGKRKQEKSVITISNYRDKIISDLHFRMSFNNYVVTMFLEHYWATLTVCEASDPSKSGDGNMRHIPIHAEGEGGGVC